MEQYPLAFREGMTDFWHTTTPYKCSVNILLIMPVYHQKTFIVNKNISKNRALLGVIIASLIGMIAASVVNGLNTYLFKDYFGNVKIMAVSGMLSTVYSIITFIGTKFVANKFGKKEWCMYGAGFAAIVYGVLFLFPIENPVLFIIINGVCYIGASGFQILIWAMVNDAIDYQELQTGTRNESIIYSTYSFFRKTIQYNPIQL